MQRPHWLQMRRNGWIGFLVTVLAAAVFALAAAHGQAARDPRRDSVAILDRASQVQDRRRPNVVDSSYATADSILRALKIRVLRRDSLLLSGSDSRVLRQSPAAGTPIFQGAIDTLLVARVVGVVVPNVIDLDSGAARLSVERREPLTVAPMLSEFHDEISPGRVFRQRPSGGESVWPETSVQLWVSIGPAPDTTIVIVPRVLDLDVERARAEILARRLALGTVRTRPGTDGSGPVVEQHPAPGDTARIGDQVQLLLTGAAILTIPETPIQEDTGSTGGGGVAVADDTVRMPFVIDTTLRRALAILNTIGIRAPVVDPRAAGTTADDWIVTGQNPLPGEPVLRTTQVRLRAAVTLAVPDLVGLSERDAEAAAAGSSFGMSVERRTRALRLFGTRVVSQSPAPATRVAVLTPIVVTVADPLPPMVPLVAGVVLLATAAGVRTWPPRPRFRAVLASDLPDVSCPEDALAEAEIALHAEVDADPPRLEHSGDSLILEEERRHV
jgi:beta-lactam-binding protein with PASTA domain